MSVFVISDNQYKSVFKFSSHHLVDKNNIAGHVCLYVCAHSVNVRAIGSSDSHIVRTILEVIICLTVVSKWLTNYTWKLQFTHEDKQRPFFGRDYAANKKAFLFSLTYVLQDDWFHFISKIPELLIIMHWTFITKKTHYTGSFRICTVLWGTFIILFISKSFLSSRRCGKWVTFILLQIIFTNISAKKHSACLRMSRTISLEGA